MTTLQETFSKGGFEFEKVWREGNKAIYRKRRAHWTAGLWNYETIRIKSVKDSEAFGKHFEGGERYPLSEEWGVAAYTSADLAGARANVARL